MAWASTPWTKTDVLVCASILVGLVCIVFFSWWTHVVLDHSKRVGNAIATLNSVASTAGVAVATAKGVTQGLGNAAAAAIQGQQEALAGSGLAASLSSSLANVLKK